jgi:uncharacterized DUF497 family protein
MIDGKFQWDDAKAASNWRDHGVTFVHATKAITDPFAIDWIDDRESYGEDRINLLGMSNGVVLHATYKDLAERIRIISARKAERH